MQYKVIKKQTIPGEAPEGTGVRRSRPGHECSGVDATGGGSSEGAARARFVINKHQ